MYTALTKIYQALYFRVSSWRQYRRFKFSHILIQKKINDKAGNPIFSMFVYYKHLVIIGHNDRFSHALSVRKYEEHNLDSLIENQCVVHSGAIGAFIGYIYDKTRTQYWVRG